jgi:hypothetical protein
VENGSPGGEGLVGGEDHRSLLEVAFVDDVEQHIGRIGSVGKIPDLVDDQHVGIDVGDQRRAEGVLSKGLGEIVDQSCSGGEQAVIAILNGAIGDSDGQMGLATARFAEENEIASLGNELRAEIGTEQRESQGRLQRKVELVDGLEKGKVGGHGTPPQTRLPTMSDFFGGDGG